MNDYNNLITVEGGYAVAVVNEWGTENIVECSDKEHAIKCLEIVDFINNSRELVIDEIIDKCNLINIANESLETYPTDIRAKFPLIIDRDFMLNNIISGGCGGLDEESGRYSIVIKFKDNLSPLMTYKDDGTKTILVIGLDITYNHDIIPFTDIVNYI